MQNKLTLYFKIFPFGASGSIHWIVIALSLNDTTSKKSFGTGPGTKK